MSEHEMRTTVKRILVGIAPEADPDHLDPDEALQDQLDIDSIDFLNFVMGVHRETGVDIPERDYPKVASLNGCVDYLLARAS